MLNAIVFVHVSFLIHTAEPITGIRIIFAKGVENTL